MAVEFLVLGEVAVRVGGRAVDAGHARQRAVLAALLADAGRVVPATELIDRVWADRPPRHARTALSGYVSRLRHVLAPAGARLDRERGGYRLGADPRTVDLHRFRHLVTLARDESTPDESLALLELALDLWRGTAFASLDSPWAAGQRAVLDAERFTAELDRDDLVLRLGRPLSPASLAVRATAHPLDERVAGQLMLALYRGGRQADALRRYETVRRTLADELGADPGPPLRELHRRILAADPDLLAPAAAVARPAAVPRQLPAPLGPLAGRARELAALDGTDAPIVVVSGTAGVGKTALALTWAHGAAGRFPDGQLYADLRGFGPGAATSPAEAVRGFLDALGVPPHRVPAGLDAQLGRYRTLVAGRRLLILLDNARDAAQVRPLLPGAPGCRVLVTSRDRLTGVVTREGAEPLPLDLLDDAGAGELLARRADAARVAAEPAAVAEVIARCARLPLALAVVAARAATRPGLTFAALAGGLRAGLDALAGTDPLTDPRAVFSWSCRGLGEPAARLFRLLSVYFGPDVGLPGAASLAGAPVAEVRPLLAELAAANLVAEPAPDRYAVHDLLRAYAAELTGEGERRAATRRLLDHYLHTATAADRVLRPDREPPPLSPASAGVTVARPSDPMAWFGAEHAALVAAVEHAAAAGFPAHAWQLARALTVYLDRQARWRDWAATQRAAVTAARELADRRARAEAHRGLAFASAELGDVEAAGHELRQAFELSTGDDHGLALTHLAAAWLCERQEHHGDALAHGRQALELYRAAGERAGEARALNVVGWCGAWAGAPDAVADCERAVSLHRELGDRYGEAASWDSLGYAHHRQGDHADAVGCFERAAGLHRAAGERAEEARVLTHLGDACAAAGEHARATDTWRAALTVLAGLDHPEAGQVRARLTAAGTLVP
jgi:DNA-binding SARP family transcriptional activator/tetratricopeptide (TPR) repeat protein